MWRGSRACCPRSPRSRARSGRAPTALLRALTLRDRGHQYAVSAVCLRQPPQGFRQHRPGRAGAGRARRLAGGADQRRAGVYRAGDPGGPAGDDRGLAGRGAEADRSTPTNWKSWRASASTSARPRSRASWPSTAISPARRARSSIS